MKLDPVIDKKVLNNIDSPRKSQSRSTNTEERRLEVTDTKENSTQKHPTPNSQFERSNNYNN